MTEAREPRKPRVIPLDDPSLTTRATPHAETSTGEAPGTPDTITLPSAAQFKSGIRWGAIFLSAMLSLTALAAGLAFTQFVSDALARNDWIGWTATAIAGIGVLAAAVIVAKELVGMLRLARLSGLRKNIAAALNDKNAAAERKSLGRLKELLASRADLKWGLARLAEHEADVRDPGELMRLAERELMVPLDREARTRIMRSAKRVSMVTALSPFVWVAMLYVMAENLRMLRSLASLYGGRPGFVGSLRLARLVVSHIIATGGLAMTDDLLGQFLGQDLLGRLSRRLGEGTFNGAMTARIGTAAIEVTRPLPFLDAEPVRLRDLLPELLRSFTSKPAPVQRGS
jgi:putative membrane protein